MLTSTVADTPTQSKLGSKVLFLSLHKGYLMAGVPPGCLKINKNLSSSFSYSCYLNQISPFIISPHIPFLHPQHWPALSFVSLCVT